MVQVENLQVHSISSSQSITNTNIEQDSGHAVLLKTNMLYDAAAIPNIGLEVSVGKGWSVGANWMYAWWSNDARHRFWRAYGGDVELRRWFSPRRESRSLMCGHHIGVYGQMLTYDIEWGGRGYPGRPLELGCRALLRIFAAGRKALQHRLHTGNRVSGRRLHEIPARRRLLLLGIDPPAEMVRPHQGRSFTNLVHRRTLPTERR